MGASTKKRPRPQGKTAWQHPSGFGTVASAGSQPPSVSNSPVHYFDHAEAQQQSCGQPCVDFLQRLRTVIMVIVAVIAATLMCSTTVMQLSHAPVAYCPCEHNLSTPFDAIATQPPLLPPFGRVGAFEGQGPVGVLGARQHHLQVELPPEFCDTSSDDEGNTTEGPQTTNNLDCLSHVQWSSSEATSILDLFCDSLSDDEANTMEGQQTTNALDSGVDEPKVVTASDTPKVTHPGNEHAEREPSTTQSSGGSSNKDKLVNSSNVSKAVIPGNNHTEHAHD